MSLLTRSGEEIYFELQEQTVGVGGGLESGGWGGERPETPVQVGHVEAFPRDWALEEESGLCGHRGGTSLVGEMRCIDKVLKFTISEGLREGGGQ